MINKTYRFATVVAVLMAFCLVFMMPVGAVDIAPSTTTDGVIWIESGGKYKLEITTPGEYNLTTGFTASQIVISTNDVLFKGNNHQITLKGPVLVSETVTSNVTLMNLNVTASTYVSDYGLIYIKGNTTLKNSVIDYSPYVYNAGMQRSCVFVTGTNASGTEIVGNTIILPLKSGDATRETRGISINSVSGTCIVTDNLFVLGESQNTNTNTLLGSYAVYIQGATDTTNVDISENTIQATSPNALNNGVSITVSKGCSPTLSISQNTFNSESNANYQNIVDIIVSYGADPVTPDIRSGINLELMNNEISSTESLMNVRTFATDVTKLPPLDVSGTVENNQGLINTVITTQDIFDEEGKLNKDNLEGDAFPSDSPAVSSPSSSGTPTPGAYYNYPRTVTDGGLVEFGTSKVVKSVTLPAGSSGKVNLHIDSTAYWPLALDSEFTFDISVDNLGEGTSYISFKIDESKLTALELTAADVGVYHEVNGEWVKLVVTYTIEDGDVIYTAETDSFSPFKLVIEEGAAVQKEEEVTPSEPVTPPVETPDVPEEPQEILPPIDTPETPSDEPESPAPILAVLAGLGAAVVLRRK